jgi:hypothetical protein
MAAPGLGAAPSTPAVVPCAPDPADAPSRASRFSAGGPKDSASEASTDAVELDASGPALTLVVGAVAFCAVVGAPDVSKKSCWAAAAAPAGGVEADGAGAVGSEGGAAWPGAVISEASAWEKASPPAGASDAPAPSPTGVTIAFKSKDEAASIGACDNL